MPIYKVDGVKKDGLQKYNVRVNYTSGRGVSKQLTRTAYGLEAAKDLEMRLTVEYKRTGGSPIKNITVQQLFDEYIVIKKYEVKETTVAKYRQNFEYYIAEAFKDIRIDKLTPVMVQEWKLTMEQKRLSLNTKRHVFSDLRAMFNYAIRMEYIHKNPITKVGTFMDKMSFKPEMEFYTAQEFTRFIGAAKKIAEEKETKHKDLSEWDFFIFFNIAFYTGLRKGEIHALKWRDIDGSYLSVKRSITQRLRGGDREMTPKTQSSIRTLQMPLPLIKMLNEHKARQMKLKNFTRDYRICGGERPLRDATIQRRNELYSQISGVKTVCIHSYRHAHVSMLANEGINIQEIARRLGHTRIEMTWNTYSHLYPREEERAVDILNSIE